MSALTPRRIALIVVAAAGALFAAGLLLVGPDYDGPTGLDLVGPATTSLVGLFATSCALSAATSTERSQRVAWVGMAAGLAGFTAATALWFFIALGGKAPISSSSAAELAYVILPICALTAMAVLPSRDDARFGFGLLLDGIIVAASLLIAVGSLTLESTATVSIPRMLFAAFTAIYLGLSVTALLIVRAAEPKRWAAPALVSAGFLSIGLAGVCHIRQDTAAQTPSGVVTLGWILGTSCFALSALLARPGPELTARTSGQWSRVSIWLPYVPSAIAVIVGGLHFWPQDRVDAFLFSAGLILIVAVLARHIMALERKRRLLEVMADAALRDTVTGLANRRLLDERLAHAAHLHVRLDVPLSVLSIRVDDFNVVNDTLGYAASDALLRAVGARIQGSVRADDTVARMGGDEFAILVEDLPEVAAQVAKRIARAFDSALEIGDNRVYIHLSIGVASAQPDEDAAITAADILNQAAAARFRAEQTSATDVQVFRPEQDGHLSRRETFRDGAARLQLLWDLRRAIDDRLLTLVYQPQFDMLTGAVCGAEALLRWEHPTLGTLEPSEFLPLVREHGLMDAVTDLVLSRAVADGASWHEAGIEIPVAVNLWARSLDDDSLPDRIMTVLDQNGMSASLLTVEITEELMVADFVKSRAVLNRLREAGIRVSIDDFGSGYSTMTYLRELPIDEVKLDRQLIAPILYDRRAATIARSVIELAEEFDIASVAEGIENEETARWLQQIGCDVVQGNYYCGPLPAGEIPHVPPAPARRALPSA